MSDSCPDCGTPLAADAIFCHRCGKNFTVEMPTKGPEDLPPPTDALSGLRAALGDRYEIERELGRGGMATVYLAKDLKHDREVAVKVLHSDFSASVGAERFTREIHLAAKLQHPNILGLYDSGSAGDLLYYVMPYVKGESLRDRLDRERMLPVDDALAITLQVSDALGYAHSQHVVHRDIKPENVLLSGGHAMVADFGIARAVSDGGDQKLTATGMSMGTPYYMAPEQASGDTVGPTADIYSLGCMLYEMLAGEPPFTGQNSMQIMARHAMEQVPSIRIVRSAVPEEVEEAIFASLGKVPADRPQTAAQFAEMLGLPPGSTTSSRVMRMSTTTRRMTAGTQSFRAEAGGVPLWRRPMVLAGTALLVVAAAFGVWKLALGGGGRHSALGTGPDAHRLAVLYLDDLSTDHSLGPVADGLTDGLIASLSGASSFTVISSAGVRPFRGTQVNPDSVARVLHVAYLVRGTVEQDGANLRVGMRLDDASGVNLQRASFTYPSANVLAIRDTLSQTVAAFIRQQLGEQFQLQQQRDATSNQTAWLLVQRGQTARRDMEHAAATGDTTGLERAYRAADSLYAAAAALDPKWPDPVTDRGMLAYRRGRLAAGDPAQIRKWTTLGLTHATAAMAIDSGNADALELRGDLTYFMWVSGLETDAAKKAEQITAAKKDLEKATTINRNQAGAWAMLAHLYTNYPTTSNTDVLMAAERAYDADEFQSGADVVLMRLVLAAYDLAQFDKAAQWCAEFGRRFPADYRAARCQLLLLTTKNVPADVPRAWRLADSVATLAPAPRTQFWKLNADMLVASVSARASKTAPALADSARHVIKGSLGDASVDPARDLALYGAIAYVILGDEPGAIDLLKTNFAVNPQRVAGYRDDPGWQFRPLQTNPDFRRLVGAGK